MSKFDRRSNGDLYINKQGKQHHKGKSAGRSKQVRQLMKTEGLSWNEASKRINSRLK